MGNIDMTKTALDQCRANRSGNHIPIHPITAGIYIAAIMAQTDLLKEKDTPTLKLQMSRLLKVLIY